MEYSRCERGHFYDAELKNCPVCAQGQEEYGETQSVGITKPIGRVMDYDPTEPIVTGEEEGFSPVTGWLVCIEGPDRGTDYRIRNGYNYIGRGEHMDICIQNDVHISNENQAVIGYDDIEKMFFFGPERGRNAVRVNGKMVINSVELSPYDVLTIGMSKMIFIPLCGENFDWNENEEKK